MTSARQTLLALHRNPGVDPFSVPREQLDALQLEAARELFTERREQIQILDRRARDTGISEIRTLADIVPLLFSHTTYKSYPQSFVKAGRWDQMTKWLGTLSARPVSNVDVGGVRDIDDWLGRLVRAGNHPVTTSGTSGKASILNRSQLDIDRILEGFRIAMCWPATLVPDRSRHYFALGPKGGYHTGGQAAAARAALYARPDSIHFLSDDALLVAQVSRMAEMRLKMADGSATPSEIAAFEAEAGIQAKKMSERFDAMVEKMLAVRHQPLLISGLWSQFWMLMQRAKARGVKDGDFHPDTAIAPSGGLKGLKLPADYQEQVFAFFGNPRHINRTYGMTEMSVSSPRCEAGNYHPVPWIIPLLLDASGETLLNEADKVVEGRFAFLDLSFDARWGGLITGDRVSVDFSDHCACGRRGVTIGPRIERFANLGEEDKIGCAGTIDAYIRGAMES